MAVTDSIRVDGERCGMFVYHDMLQCIVAVAEQYEADGQTTSDYDSRSLMQFCKSHQLLLGTYELLSEQHASTTSTHSAPSSTAAEHDIKSVSQSVCHLSLLHEVCVTGDHELCICRVFFCAAEMWRSDVMMFHELAKQLQNQLKFYYTLQPHYNTFGIWNRLTKLMFIILFWLSAVCLNSEQN